MRKLVTALAISGLIISTDASAQKTAQEIAAEKAQADLDKVKLEVEKLGVDIGKSRIDSDNAALAPLRAVPNAGATFSEAGKTAELTLLRRTLAAGATAKLVDALVAVVPPSTSVRPKVIFGAAAPSVDQWLVFREKRLALADKLRTANEAWNSANSSLMSFVAVSGVIAIAATVLPMLKTETVMTGSGSKIEAAELQYLANSALKSRGYATDDAEFRIPDFVEAKRELLKPIAGAYETAKTNLKAFEERPNPTPRQKAVAAELKATVASYDNLASALETQDGGRMSAVTIMRQGDLVSAPPNQPLVYVVDTQIGLTAMTKKGFFTGMFGEVPAYAYGVAMIDYVVVPMTGEIVRGAVICRMSRRKTTDLLALHATSFPHNGETGCDG